MAIWMIFKCKLSKKILKTETTMKKRPLEKEEDNYVS